MGCPAGPKSAYAVLARSALRSAIYCDMACAASVARPCLSLGRCLSSNAREAAIEATFRAIYLPRVFSARSASVSHLSAISMKRDLCSEERAASANRMQSAALLRNWAKMSKCASISVNMGTAELFARGMSLDPGPCGNLSAKLCPPSPCVGYSISFRG